MTARTSPRLLRWLLLATVAAPAALLSPGCAVGYGGGGVDVGADYYEPYGYDYGGWGGGYDVGPYREGYGHGFAGHGGGHGFASIPGGGGHAGGFSPGGFSHGGGGGGGGGGGHGR